MIDLQTQHKKENKKIKFKEIKKPNFWTEEEDKILKEKAKEFNYKNWNSIANFIPGRTSIQCSARYRRIRPGLIKGAWDKDEDEKLLLLYEKYGKNWAAISKEMPHRTGKQIRDRFLNSLDSKFERGKFTEEEDQMIIKFYKIYGNSWARIAKKLKTRTGDMVKNRFYSSLKKNILKNKNFLKKKRKGSISVGRKIKKKSKKKSLESNNKSNLVEQKDSTLDNELDDKKGEEKSNSNFTDNIEDSVEENDEIKSKKIKMTNINSTNIISNDSNNFNPESENKKTNTFKKTSENNINDFNENENIITKPLLINNENKIENDINNNSGDFNIEENNKKNEISNYNDFNDNYGLNSEFFFELNESVNNNLICLNQKDEVDERLEKLKNCPKLELEYKQNLKEQLDIIFDLENIINQKLFSVQKQLENN